MSYSQFLLGLVIVAVVFMIAFAVAFHEPLNPQAFIQ